MIAVPRRSVTRFFIPLIDVLTLLFCIFLLMPLVEAAGDADAAPAPGAADAEELHRLREENARLRREADARPEALREEVERLRREKVLVLQDRLAHRVLEIDPATGRLLYYDPERTEIRSEADARALIDRDRKARAADGRELYYLVLYPRDPGSPYPHREQRAAYDRWFADVPHGWDVPGLGPARPPAPAPGRTP